MKIYTKTGDKGYTGLIGGKRISKSNLRIITYGTVDEVNSYIGLCIAVLAERQNKNFSLHDVINLLTLLQNDLFIIGSDLADPNLKSNTVRVKQEMIDNLENNIDRYEKDLDPIKYFILPGGSLESAYLHVARTIVRRAETNVSKLLTNTNQPINNLILVYLNRLSDLFFVLARLVNKRLRISDIAWRS
ncbi:MAG: cob(I)yrinic acid a,c-diamide adenosyltransferase [Nitrososphaeraceae archaeon]